MTASRFIAHDIVLPTAVSPLLPRIVSLADTNSRFLGHFPKSCYSREADNGRILAAVGEDGTVLGFVLYRTTRDRAVIQQLCVDENYRRCGVARSLIAALKKRTSHLPAIVCHCAREFEAVESWKSLGFIPMAEKAGRGKNARPLIRFVLDNGHDNLFKSHFETRAADTTVAALDVNVAIDLRDADDTDLEIAVLRADWLLEEVSLWVTAEAHSEVERKDDTTERQKSLAFIRGFPALNRDEQRERLIHSELLAQFGSPSRPQTRSDLLHIAQSIVGNAGVFLTRDEALLQRSEMIRAKYGLDVLRPSDLVVRLDEIERSTEYAPVRLAGTRITRRKPIQSELDAVIDRFVNYGEGEKRSALASVVRDAVSSRDHFRVEVLHDGSQRLIGLLVVDNCTAGRSTVRTLRLHRNRLAETLATHLLHSVVTNGITSGSPLVTCEDRCPTHPLESAAITNGFVKADGVWVKWSTASLTDRDQVRCHLSTCSSGDSGLIRALRPIQDLLNSSNQEAAVDAAIERAVWPGVLHGSSLPTFVVPIKPEFAGHLFDAELSAETLFGGDPSLLLNQENVYFRSGHAEIVRAPGRILWYVSADSGAQIRHLRATSPVLATRVGPARKLFSEYEHLGVYRWEQVLEIAKDDPNGTVMAIHFGPSFVFRNPVPGETVRSIIDNHRGGGKPPLSMPIEVPRRCAEEIYELAFG